MAEEKKKKKKSDKPKIKLLWLRYFVQIFVQITGVFPGVLWFRTKKVYESKLAKKHIRGGALLVANHTCFYDPVYLTIAMWYRRQWFLATTKLFDTKVKKFLFGYVFPCIPIDAEKGSIGAIKNAIALLKRGKMVTVFPEGHIYWGSEGLDSLKQGMILMAMQADVPIIPCYIKKKERKFERLTIAIGEPIKLDPEAKKKNPLEYMKNMTNIVSEKMKYLESLVEQK